ncbi:MAG: aldo/keto reductase [Calditrichia bacterium]
MAIQLTDRITLNNGIKMPRFGLGVYLADSGKETQRAVEHALASGYRLIDTARMYGNEKDVGTAVRNSGISRDEVFITTKLWNSDHGFEKAQRAFEKSLRELNLDYIDLFLIHWPVENIRNETWKALERIVKSKQCRAIGVSNYTISHLKELLSDSETAPAINQVEFSPFLYQKELLEFCREHEIQLEAYSPLTRGKKFDHPLLQKLSEKYRKSPAQIMIRWSLQHDLIVIPKSTNPQRIEENAQVFDFVIEEDDMNTLDGLDDNYRVSWDPSNIH